jgi:tRNA(adenine34) deaminase
MILLSTVYEAGDERDRAFMELAIAVAKEAAAKGEVPVGAVIVSDGEVIAACGNSIESEGDPTMHAEVVAIRAAAKKLSRKWLAGCTLYVTAEPCAMCAGAAVLARLDRIVAGTPSDKSGACGSVLDVLGADKLNHRVEYSVGLMREECAALLSDFFGERRKSAGGDADEKYC